MFFWPQLQGEGNEEAVGGKRVLLEREHESILVKRTRGGLKMDYLGNFGRCVQCVPLYRDLIGVSAEAMLHRLAWPHKYRIIFNFVCKLKLPRELINAQRAGSDPGSSAMLGLEQAFCCSAC